MNKNQCPIYFYVPQDDVTDHYPVSIDACPSEYFRFSRFSWIWQTYMYLKDTGLNCQLVSTFPEEGIVFGCTNDIPLDVQPGRKLLMIASWADLRLPPYAQIYIVQNPQQVMKPYITLGDRFLLPGLRHYIPHWRQPGLIPRDPARGDRFENIAYLGRSQNLAPEILSSDWAAKLKEMGLTWHLVSNPKEWQDYSYIDAFVAIRQFTRSNEFHWKPATKLQQAWYAGTPAILGQESAYRAARKSDLDYLEATSLDDALRAIRRLKEDPALRVAMMKNGQLRAEETSPERLTALWQQFFLEVAIPAYERWCSQPAFMQQSFILRRSLAVRTKSMRGNLQKIVSMSGLKSQIKKLLRKG